jgi:hypothetical protein
MNACLSEALPETAPSRVTKAHSQDPWNGNPLPSRSGEMLGKEFGNESFIDDRLFSRTAGRNDWLSTPQHAWWLQVMLDGQLQHRKLQRWRLWQWRWLQ